MSHNIKNSKKAAKKLAIEIAEQYIDSELQAYTEPAREGTPKGDPIGFSTKKLETALWMILFPNTYRLKEISKIVNISEGTIRVWRTQEDFKQRVNTAYREFGQIIFQLIDMLISKSNVELFQDDKDDDARQRAKLAKDLRINEENIETLPSFTELDDKIIILKSVKTVLEKELGDKFPQGKRIIVIDDDHEKLKELDIINKVEDPDGWLFEVTKMLPFFNFGVTKAIINKAAKKFHAGLPGYEFFLLGLLKESSVQGEKSLQQWVKQPWNVMLMKVAVESMIDTISDPDTWERLGPEKIKEIADQLKRLIFHNLDVLSKP